MNGFERRKEQKKESIRQAAIELFKVFGFGKVSIGDIAHKANVSHVTIYNHFGSKDGLVRDVVRTVLSGLVAKSGEIIYGDKPYLEKLEAIIFSKAELAGQYQGELMKTAVRDYPEMAQLIETMWQNEIDKLIDDLVEEGREKGYIHKGLSQQAIKLYFEIVRKGAFSSLETINQLTVDSKLAEDLNRLFLFGLVGRDIKNE